MNQAAKYQVTRHSGSGKTSKVDQFDTAEGARAYADRVKTLRPQGSSTWYSVDKI